MIRSVLHGIDSTVPVKLIPAIKSKADRALDVACFTDRKLIHHVGSYPALEDQMCTWTPEMDFSPDRIDALVWGMFYVMGLGREAPSLVVSGVGKRSGWRIGD